MDEAAAGSGQAERARPTNINVIFSLTVLPHEKAMIRRARRLVGHEADARDLVQETLERALRTFHAFRPGTAVWAWLRTIMNSVWIDGWRRRQAAAKICHLPSIDLAAYEPEPPSDGMDEEEILDRLPAAIAQLPPIFREVLELRLQANRSYGEISERLGIPSRTVGTRILRARRQLRAILEEQISEAVHASEPPQSALNAGSTAHSQPAALAGHWLRVSKNAATAPPTTTAPIPVQSHQRFHRETGGAAGSGSDPS